MLPPVHRRTRPASIMILRMRDPLYLGLSYGFLQVIIANTFFNLVPYLNYLVFQRLWKSQVGSFGGDGYSLAASWRKVSPARWPQP